MYIGHSPVSCDENAELRIDGCNQLVFGGAALLASSWNQPFQTFNE